MRFFAIVSVAAALFGLSGCGYHTLGAATHLPPDVHTLSVPVFATRTEAYHTETAMTEAVIREFAARTRFRVTPDARAGRRRGAARDDSQGDVAPLTYNSSTQQSSSFLITMVVSVTLTGRDGKVLYENKNYVFRQQYQSTTDLPTFFAGESGGRRAALARVCAAAGGRCAGRVLGSRSGEAVTNPGAPGCEFGATSRSPDWPWRAAQDILEPHDPRIN